MRCGNHRQRSGIIHIQLTLVAVGYRVIYFRIFGIVVFERSCQTVRLFHQCFLCNIRCPKAQEIDSNFLCCRIGRNTRAPRIPSSHNASCFFHAVVVRLRDGISFPCELCVSIVNRANQCPKLYIVFHRFIGQLLHDRADDRQTHKFEIINVSLLFKTFPIGVHFRFKPIAVGVENPFPS